MKPASIPARRPDWAARLSSYLAACGSQPFAWGVMDCTLFAAGAVEAMTGVDPAARHRGQYKTAKGALSRLRRAGCETPADLAALHLPEVPVHHAGIGDVVAITTDDGPALGIWQGEFAYAVGPDGFGLVDPSRVTRAFRV